MNICIFPPDHALSYSMLYHTLYLYLVPDTRTSGPRTCSVPLTLLAFLASTSSRPIPLSLPLSLHNRLRTPYVDIY